MTTAFPSSSRLANFRQKKSSHIQEPLTFEKDLKLTLPNDPDQKSAYEPSSTFHNTRTSMRLLKGRIQRKESCDNQDLRSTQSNLGSQQKLALDDKPAGLKLVINDSPQIAEKKQPAIEQPQRGPLKRILIQKETAKEQPKIEQRKEQKIVQVKQVEQKQEAISVKRDEYVNPHDEKPIIKEQDVEESKQQPENETDLVICPEGCGRKFNRKALEKHAKACKVVFMSKRKQFNSEAKRITTKQQANIVKQNKQKEKAQFGKTRSKGFEKTSDNWKAASQDFRSAIKAVKKDQEAETGEEKVLVMVVCQFCQKKFADVLIEKHHENCVKKKERDNKKKTTKKR